MRVESLRPGYWIERGMACVLLWAEDLGPDISRFCVLFPSELAAFLVSDSSLTTDQTFHRDRWTFYYRNLMCNIVTRSKVSDLNRVPDLAYTVTP